MNSSFHKSIGNIIVFLFLSLYILSMIWINFHNYLWYQTDCYTYAYEGRLMWESSTCFPPNWVFSNQYHIISSPNISALFFGLTKDSVQAMALTSSLSIFIVLISFVWCISPFMKKQAVWGSALCLVGGVIFGTNAATYISGLQVLYTMSSFYACYLIGILLTLGVWLRLCSKRKISFILILAVTLMNFALGMQSLREMLVLIIPLFLTHLFFSTIFRYESIDTYFPKKGLVFIGGMFIAELLGHFLMNYLSVPTVPIIGELQLEYNPAHLIANLWASTKNILRISGLAIAADGLQYLPLSICALGVMFSIFCVFYLIIIKHDRSPLAVLIFFSVFSLLCVYGVGIFLMRTRDIYYFVYWLLASLCFGFLLNRENQKMNKIVLVIIILICSTNYCFSFIPNFKDYRENNRKLEAFTQSLIDRGIRVIYMDASPIFAAASNDQIISQTYWLDYSMADGYPLTVFPGDKHAIIYDDNHYDHSLICISDYYRNSIEQGPEDFRNELYSNLVLFDQFFIGQEVYSFYQSKKRVIHPFPVLQEQPVIQYAPSR